MKYTSAPPHIVWICSALLNACSISAHAQHQPRDCTIPNVDRRISECTVVRMASEFDTCLAADQIDAHSCIVMDSDLTFCDADMSVPITALFDRSDKTLDCAGGTVDHGWGRVDLPGGAATTQQTRMPAVRFYDDRSLDNIAVRNCTIRGTNHIGIQVTRVFSGELGGNGKLDDNEPLPTGHTNYTFEDLVIEDVGLGIYLGAYSDEVLINRVHIDNSQRIAIYSEAGTHNLKVSNSIISNNQTREAIAIDSTYDSEVSDTLFLNNREGAINVYQNCGELKGIVCPIVRSTSASNNVIKNNSFLNNGITGVQIASRQGRNHTQGWCSSLDGRAGQFTDTAENNTISDNTFVCSEGTALLVKDGPNLASNNTIVARENCVPFEISTGGLGADASSLLDGIVLRGNRIDSDRPPRLRNLSSGVQILD